MSEIKWIPNTMPSTEDRHLPLMSVQEAEKALAFHRTIPGYRPTPFISLNYMANELGISDLWVKDESYRFGLNAFKVLGGSYAIAKYIAKQTAKDISDLDYDTLTSEQLREDFGQATFFTATDGNHGRGVAWAANRLQQKAVVYMPKGSSQTRLLNIRAEHATATIEDGNYDECVRMAAKAAAETANGVVIQDTAWEGYEEIPSWIMQGYGTMALEADRQIRQMEQLPPTHIFIQAGVGSLAGAIQGYFANAYPECPPKITVVEADAAACLYKGALQGDGKEAIVTGDLDTIMAGLACGEPNTISWDILKNHAAVFVSAPDWVAAKGMRMLAVPCKGDKPITSGESGAVPMGVVVEILQNPIYRELKDYLQLNRDSRILLFSTEGDTDPERYRNIVWNGKER